MNEPISVWDALRPLRVVITGAADGAGAALSRLFASRGAALVVADRDEVALARVRQDTGATAVRCDVLDERSVTALFDTAERTLGEIDLLINAAGSGYVRTLGVMRSSREFARRPRAGKAYIVNLASAPSDAAPGFEYSGSPIAFARLSEGLARAIESSDLKVLTFDRIDQPELVNDLAEQLINQLSSGANIQEGGADSATA